MTTVETLGWVLLHFAWQGAAAAVVLWIALLVTPSRRAPVRYALGCAALLLMTMAPVATAMRLAASPAAPISPQPREEIAAASLAPDAAALDARHAQTTSRVPDVRAGSLRWTPATSLVHDVDAALPWVVAGWALGVLLLSIRLLGGWWHTRSLRTQRLSPVPDWCVEPIARLTKTLRVSRPVTFAVSLSIPVPMVIGHVKPLVLLPISALSGLSPQQLEAILAHELAHVRRHDYLVNLIQTVIETVLFYHPAVWWVSSQVRVLREHCCDDLAVAACGDRKRYVQALLSLEHLRGESPMLALAATDGPLFERARRVLGHVDRASAPPRLAAAAIALGVAVLALAGVSTASQEPARSGAANPVAQTRNAAPVIAAPQQSGPLAERWAGSEREARNRRTSRYWIGYSIRPVAGLPPFVYMDRNHQFIGSRSTQVLPGRPLNLPGTEPDAIKVLFAVDAGGGSQRLIRVHASTAPLPVDLEGMPVFWLGAADAAHSLERVDGLYARASTVDLKKDLVDVAAFHDDSVRVVSWLEQRLAGADADAIREDAAEGLARHPIQASLRALDRTARADRSPRVRQEAAEALGELQMAEATAALAGLVATLDDLDVRREAVEALGESPDAQALVELRALAEMHAEVELRRQAIETLSEHLGASEAVALLREAIERDRDLDVRREAVERLADVEDPLARAALVELARSHVEADMRAEAIESLGDALSAPDTAEILAEIARRDASERVRDEAMEALAELADSQGIAALIEIARSHAEEKVREQAMESLLDSEQPEARKFFERALGK